MNLKRTFIFILGILFFYSAQANELMSDSVQKEPVLNRPYRSLQFGIARTSSVFRDFATSPLFYFGSPMQYCLAWSKDEGKMERRLSLKYQSGTFNPELKEVHTPSTVSTIYLQYSRLWYLTSWKKTDFRLGGMLDFGGNLRINPSLQNNAAGLEIFNTLFLSAKASRDVSRQNEKSGKFLFLFKYRRVPRRRTISFQLNAAVMNNTLRNGYIYSNQANITNKPNIFYNYQFNTFSGYRLNTALEYSVFLSNGNAIRYSWNWDAFQSGEKFNRLEMAQHAFQVSFLFQIPKREKK